MSDDDFMETVNLVKDMTEFHGRLVEEAKSLIIKHFTNTRPGYYYDIVSAGFCPWEDDAVVAVTISERSRATHYEVWEVCFTIDSAWCGEGVFGRVAHTVDPDVEDKADPDLQFDEFAFNLNIKYMVEQNSSERSAP